MSGEYASECRWAMIESKAMIEVTNLVKDYRIFERKEGLMGAFGQLFRRRYSTLRAVDRVSFTIDPGEMVGVIGANGAGKSTTIKMLTGILVPTAGSIRVAGFVPYRQRRRYTYHVGAVFGQRSQLWWDIPVIESYRLLQKIYQVSPGDFESRLRELQALLDLKPLLNKPVRKLSLGQKMRCELVASLLHQPGVLFLDEPTIGLDVEAKARVRGVLNQVNQLYRTTMVLTTHDLADIERLCPRVLVIDKGSLLLDGPLEELRALARRECRIAFRIDGEVEEGSPFDGLPVTWHRSGEDDVRYLATFDQDRVGKAEVIRRVLGAYEILDIGFDEEGIEDVVRRIYRRGEIGGAE